MKRFAMIRVPRCLIAAPASFALLSAALGVFAQTPAAEPDAAQVERFASTRLIDGSGQNFANATLRIRGDVILDANPLADTNNTRRINEVHLRGQRVDREGSRALWVEEN